MPYICWGEHCFDCNTGSFLEFKKTPLRSFWAEPCIHGVIVTFIRPFQVVVWFVVRHPHQVSDFGNVLIVPRPHPPVRKSVWCTCTSSEFWTWYDNALLVRGALNQLRIVMVWSYLHHLCTVTYCESDWHTRNQNCCQQAPKNRSMYTHQTLFRTEGWGLDMRLLLALHISYAHGDDTRDDLYLLHVYKTVGNGRHKRVTIISSQTPPSARGKV